MATISVCGPVIGSPEGRSFQSGSFVFRFSVRDQAYIKPPEGEQYAPPQYYDIEVWGKYGMTLADRIAKGNIVAVSGQYVMEEYLRQDTGERVKKWLVTSPSVTFPLTRAQAQAVQDLHGGNPDYPSREEVPF